MAGFPVQFFFKEAVVFVRLNIRMTKFYKSCLRKEYVKSLFKKKLYCLLNDKKKRRSKNLVQGLCVQKPFWLSSRTLEQFKVMPRK